MSMVQARLFLLSDVTLGDVCNRNTIANFCNKCDIAHGISAKYCDQCGSKLASKDVFVFAESFLKQSSIPQGTVITCTYEGTSFGITDKHIQCGFYPTKYCEHNNISWNEDILTYRLGIRVMQTDWNNCYDGTSCSESRVAFNKRIEDLEYVLHALNVPNRTDYIRLFLNMMVSS